MSYKDPVIQAYLDLIKANCGGAIKEFYQGEPIRIPASNFPCVIAAKRQTRVGFHSNAEDEHGMALAFTVITDVRQDLNTADGAENAVAGIATLYDIIEGRNADFTLKDTSILDILRSNQLVNAQYGLRTDLSTVTQVDYGMTLRGREPESWSIEGRVDIICSFNQVR